MAIPIKRAQRPASERELIKLGESSGGDIPTEYREFLSRNNGAVPETNGFQISKTGNSSGVNEFLSVETVLREKERLGIRLAKEAYPIAHAEGGNLVCIMLGGQWNGKIFFWDHELEDESEFPRPRTCLSWLRASTHSGTR